MKIDIHYHAVGHGVDINNADNDPYFNSKDNQLLFTRVLNYLVEHQLINMDADLNKNGAISTNEYFDLAYRLLRESKEVDAIVLLAFDAVYAPDTGLLDEKTTNLWVTNRYLARKVDELNARFALEAPPVNQKKFLLGASVSPNRKDWESELDFAINQTDAVLIKWLPSTQHLYLDSDRYGDFYRTLASEGMPLLCHVGPEYTFPEGIRNGELDNYTFLDKALTAGVTVIAAHCASPVFPIIDADHTKDFLAFMKNANAGGQVKLWADTSALSLSTRLPIIGDIVDNFPPEWLVYGSDFPMPIDSWPHLPYITHDVTKNEYVDLCKTKNILDRDVKIKRAHGFSDSILENAGKVLRIKQPAYNR